MSRLVIAVDGPSGSGKTTLCKQLAARLGWVFFSTGTLYRAVGLLARRRGVALSDGPALGQLIESAGLHVFSTEDGQQGIAGGGEVFGADLYYPETSEAASLVARLEEVRRALLPVQRAAFPGQSLVAEGRDVGTVVFPDAAVKFFVDAPAEVRAQRRLADFQAQGIAREGDESGQEVLAREIHDRDTRDSGRELAPLRAAPDAILVDNSAGSLTDVLETMYSALLVKGISQFGD